MTTAMNLTLCWTGMGMSEKEHATAEHSIAGEGSTSPTLQTPRLQEGLAISGSYVKKKCGLACLCVTCFLDELTFCWLRLATALLSAKQHPERYERTLL